MTRHTYCRIDVAAYIANLRDLARNVAPARMCAVVKANAYGHGAVELATAVAAVEIPHVMLAVALVSEAHELRAAGISTEILLLSEPHRDELHDAVSLGLHLSVYNAELIDALDEAAGAHADATPVPVHVKIDTGMHRVGVEPHSATARARQVVASEHLVLGGVYTHFACADSLNNSVTVAQRDAFVTTVDDLRTADIDPGIVHAANSAATLTHPTTYFDMVRCGITSYGLDPSPEVLTPQKPVMSLVSYVSHVQYRAAGDAVSYGHRWAATNNCVLATVPVGYADGVPRTVSGMGAEVLIGGRRCEIVGTVTMDQIMVNCGSFVPTVGDDVVLIGEHRETGESIRASEWAAWANTNTYEIACGISSRVPRIFEG